MWGWLKSLFEAGEYEHIELFQLEGLVRNQIPFLLLDLRKSSHSSVSPQIEKLLEVGQPVSSNQVEEYLKEKSFPDSHPVVLVCEKGRRSKKVALDLQKKGRVNIYFVKGGVKKMESEI